MTQCHGGGAMTAGAPGRVTVPAALTFCLFFTAGRQLRMLDRVRDNDK